jgi:outer membrane biosynthesis protein TonB
MRKSAILTAVAALLGACSSLSPPESVRAPEPIQAPEPQPEPAPPPQPAPQPKVAARPREVRIDNTSLESFRASWQRLRASLSPAQQANLQNAVARLTFEPYGGGADLPRNLRDSPIVPEMIRDRIAGLTYAQIIELSL